MKFIRLLPLWVAGFSSLAWAKEPGASGSHRPSAPPVPARASGAPAFAKVGAIPSGHYEPGPGIANAPPRMVWKTAVGEIADRIQRDEIKKEEVAARYADLDKTRAARRTARLEQLRSELGAADFERPEYRRELARHHHAVAFLERARLVAESEVEGMRRAKALMRINAMLYRENNRHDAAIAVLKNPAAAPSSSVPSASSTAPKASAR